MKVKDYKKIYEKVLTDETKQAKTERKNKEKMLKDFTNLYDKLAKEYGIADKNDNINDNVNKKALQELLKLIDKYKIDYEKFQYEPQFGIYKKEKAVGHLKLQKLYIDNKKPKTNNIGIEGSVTDKNDDNEVKKDNIKKDNTKKESIIPDKYKQIADGLISQNKAPILSTSLVANVLSSVKLIQSVVGADVDGKFGNKTKSAVIEFQKNNNITPSGIVDADTWKVILGKEIPTYKPNIKPKAKTKTDVKKTVKSNRVSDIGVIKHLFEYNLISKNVKIILEKKLSEYLTDDEMSKISLEPNNDELIVYYDNSIVKSAPFKMVDGKYEFLNSSDKEEISSIIVDIKNGVKNTENDNSIVLFTNKQKGEKISLNNLREKIKEKKDMKYSIGNTYTWMVQNKNNKEIIKSLRNLYKEITGEDVETKLLEDEIVNDAGNRQQFTEILMDNIKNADMVANLIYQACEATFGTHNEMIRVIGNRLTKLNDEKYIKDIASSFQKKYNESIIDAIKDEENSEGEFYNEIQLFKNIL